LKVQREFNTAGGSEFQVRGAAVLNNRLSQDLPKCHYPTLFICFNHVILIPTKTTYYLAGPKESFITHSLGSARVF